MNNLLENFDEDNVRLEISYFSRIKNSIVNLFRKKEQFYKSDTGLKYFFEYLNYMNSNSYLNCYTNETLDSMRSLDIYLITSHYDVLLDNSVQFAKIWKGMYVRN